MRFPPFWYNTQCRLVVSSVLGQPVEHIFKDQAVQGDWLTLEDQPQLFARRSDQWIVLKCLCNYLPVPAA
jgi:hypothetical protein